MIETLGVTLMFEGTVTVSACHSSASPQSTHFMKHADSGLKVAYFGSLLSLQLRLEPTTMPSFMDAPKKSSDDHFQVSTTFLWRPFRQDTACLLRRVVCVLSDCGARPSFDGYAPKNQIEFVFGGGCHNSKVYVPCETTSELVPFSSVRPTV